MSYGTDGTEVRRNQMKKNNFTEKLKNMPIKKKLIISHGSIIVSTFILIVLLLCGMMAFEKKLVQMYEGPSYIEVSSF